MGEVISGMGRGWRALIGGIVKMFQNNLIRNKLRMCNSIKIQNIKSIP